MKRRFLEGETFVEKINRVEREEKIISVFVVITKKYVSG